MKNLGNKKKLYYETFFAEINIYFRLIIFKQKKLSRVFISNMLNISTENRNYKPAFTSGITRKLSRNYYHCEADVVEIFNKHPQKNGIAGQLPINWIRNIDTNKKHEVIKDIYSQFAKTVELAKTNIENAAENINTVLRKHKILAPNQSYNIVKIDTSGAVYTANGYILSGNNTDSYFIKEFADLSSKSPRLYKLMTESNGKYVELARALNINNRIKDRHIMHTHWGDTKNGYMVSEYVKPLKEYKSSIEIKEFYDSEKTLVNDLYKKYGFTYEEIKKYKVQTGYEYEDKFYSYPEDRIIYSYFSNMFEKYGLKDYDLHCNPDNYIITTDKKGNPLLKLIDFGGITHI